MALRVKPVYWDQACRELSHIDPVMGGIIQSAGAVHLVSRGDPFVTLARSVVGQQISVKAAQTVWDRFARAARTVEPLRVSRMRMTTLRGCGLSERKAEYIRDLAGGFVQRRVDPKRWPQLPDEAIIAELTAVRGIGRWTAEMFLIFNLLRPDVYPVDDIGLLRGIGRAYGDGEKVSRAHASQFGERWRPWRTVATWYLWRSLDPLPVEY
ncbi:MAG: DNA-3-methyladenine glycosylase 2 family protein [Betaproteobacteria bacterium]|nr:DNA-3-methyladenine glycosylase 2 family protein [Betaproteobacteria bacterium]